MVSFQFVIVLIYFCFFFYHLASCPYRNTSPSSNGWAIHQTKPYPDNVLNGSELWLSDYNKQFYRYNSKRNPHEVNNHTTARVSGDHRIRITVNCGDEDNIFSDQNRIYNNEDESESGASVTIVEIDNFQQQLNDDTNTTNIIKNTLHVTPTTTATTTKYINSSVKQYNEKPIDVPEDFERKAYEFQRNKLSPFVRNLQPNSQVRFFFFFFHIDYCALKLYCNFP